MKNIFIDVSTSLSEGSNDIGDSTFHMYFFDLNLSALQFGVLRVINDDVLKQARF
jgi:hypothetical protein